MTRDRVLAAALGLAVVLAAGCAPSGRPASVPPRPSPSTAPPTTSAAAAATAAEIARAAGTVGLQVQPAQVPFRAPEPPGFETAPRSIVQVLLPDDPDGAFVTVFEFRSTDAAAGAGRRMADYLASGFGRAQFVPDTRHVLRQLGTTLVLFSWSPRNAPDARTEALADALATIGQEIAVRG